MEECGFTPIGFSLLKQQEQDKVGNLALLAHCCYESSSIPLLLSELVFPHPHPPITICFSEKGYY
jgi:hypothetical protein